VHLVGLKRRQIILSVLKWMSLNVTSIAMVHHSTFFKETYVCCMGYKLSITLSILLPSIWVSFCKVQWLVSGFFFMFCVYL